MKLCFVVPGFSADENDWCIPAHTDVVKQLAMAHEVHVFAMRYPHRAGAYRIGDAIVHSFNGVGSRGAGSGMLWRKVMQEIGEEHRRDAFDVIHAIFGSEAGCVAVATGRQLGVPSVVWMVNGELAGLRGIRYGADLYVQQRWMNRVILRFADRVLCGCELMACEARKRLAGARQRRIVVLPLGVNASRFNLSKRGMNVGSTPSAAGGYSNFVNVGSLSPVKDQATLLQAFARVVETGPQAHLTIVGEGPLENELHGLAAELGVAAEVTFAGYVPHDELAKLYGEADVFVQASRHEGQGMALLEAAACGAAVAGTNVGALADLAREGGAIGTPIGSPDALADAMIEGYSQRAVFGEQGSRIVEREYNLESICARLTSVYRGLRSTNDFAFGPDTTRA